MIKAGDFTLENLQSMNTQGVMTTFYRIVIRVPNSYIGNMSNGPLSAFSVSDKPLYEVILCGSGQEVIHRDREYSDLEIVVQKVFAEILVKEIRKLEDCQVVFEG